MTIKKRVLGWTAVLLGASLTVSAQDFKVFDRKVQVHGFVSQGFFYSNDNSYLTMKTSEGSGAFTDGGVNLSTHITDRFRVGAQGYSRRLGELNKGQVSLDWAYGDYKFKDWFGFRGGKVKTALGLYNDMQDVDSLFTWALLPQSMYPIDLRGSTIAHIGGDFYGTIRLHRYGSVAYTAYGGVLPNDPHQGYLYALSTAMKPGKYTGPIGGGDLKWTTPVKGLLAGASYMTQHPYERTVQVGLMGSSALTQESKKREISQFYVQYMWNKLHIDGEYRRDYRDQVLVGAGPTGGRAAHVQWNSRSWYTAGSYRICRWFEAGSYYSRFVPIWQDDHSPASDHIYDKVVTGRFDINRFWTVKVEGHFIDGYGQVDSARGFYGFSRGTADNMKPQTNMLVLRTGFSF